MGSKRVPLAICAIILSLLACTIGQGGQVAEDLPGTITAQALTLQAPSATAGLPTGTPPPLVTNTPSVPEVRVSSATNCRTGPSTAYDLLWTMQPNLVAEVVGKHTPTGYWIIKYPGGLCWLWGQYATVSGNITALPEYPQPPTPTASKPAAPQNFKASTSCSPAPGPIFGVKNLHVELSWTDVATNEEGYKIFRNDDLLFTLSANSTSAEDDTQVGGLFLFLTSMPSPTPFPGVKYSIRAFNGNGNSEWRELYANCP